MSCQGRVVQLLKGRWHASCSLGMAGLQANTHALLPMGPVHWHEDRYCTHIFKTSFFPSTIKIWNNLQPVITNSTTIPQLRQALQSTLTFGRLGLHAQPGLSGDLTLTSIIYYTIMYNQIATQLQNIKSCNQSPTHWGIIVLMLSYLLPIR